MQEIKTIDDKIDEFEAIILEAGEPKSYKPKHFFLPGMYLRTVLMEQFQWVTSMVHNTVHPFFIRRGKVSVYSENIGEELLEIGYMGVTTPGTRRILFMHEETEWTTIHPLPFITGLENSLSDEEKDEIVEGIEDLILMEHINPLLGGIIKNNVLTKVINELK
jgi:hypothetical protein